MNSLLYLFNSLIGIYIWLLIISVVFSWLLGFNLLNVNSSAIQTISRSLKLATEPALQFIRRFSPSLGSIDISPLILIILLVFLQRLLVELFDA